jgi:hypothetical protein
LSHDPNPFCSDCFWDKVSLFFPCPGQHGPWPSDCGIPSIVGMTGTCCHTQFFFSH